MLGGSPSWRLDDRRIPHHEIQDRASRRIVKARLNLRAFLAMFSMAAALLSSPEPQAQARGSAPAAPANDTDDTDDTDDTKNESEHEFERVSAYERPRPIPRPPAWTPPRDPLGCLGDRTCQQLTIAGTSIGTVSLAALGSGVALLVRPNQTIPEEPAYTLSFHPAGWVLTTLGTGLLASAVMLVIAGRKHGQRAVADTRSTKRSRGVHR